MQSLIPIHCFLFETQIIKNGFTDSISYRVFKRAPGHIISSWDIVLFAGLYFLSVCEWVLTISFPFVAMC